MYTASVMRMRIVMASGGGHKSIYSLRRLSSYVTLPAWFLRMRLNSQNGSQQKCDTIADKNEISHQMKDCCAKYVCKYIAPLEMIVRNIRWTIYRTAGLSAAHIDGKIAAQKYRIYILTGAHFLNYVREMRIAHPQRDP